MKSLFSLEGKVAIVTGASRWTGKTIALEMARAGADVVVCARTPDLVEATAAEIRSLGRRSIAVPTDLRVAEQVNNMVKKALQEFGRVDILVNSAGASFAAHAIKISEDGWDAIVRENMKTVFICSKAVVESMIEHGGGSIINIASTDGLRSAISNAAYGAAKAGVMGLTMSLAVEWARYNIRVNAVAPGFIGMGGRPQQGGVAQPIERDPYVQGIFDRIPLKRAAKPEEIAGTVIYLASDAGGYTTGAMIVVDGGMTCMPG